YDAADDAGESRIYGGIHVSPDDGPGRIMGSKIGRAAFTHARKYWDASIIKSTPITLKRNGEITYRTIPGYHYTLESGTDLTTFPTIEATHGIATGHEQSLVVPTNDPRRFFRMKIMTP
ncbi:MAG: hypothetical protein ACI8UZ_002813, partial [Akkermansiaceae bacterium]